MSCLRFLPVFAFFLLPCSTLRAQQNWELLEDKSGIAIYGKDTPYSDIKELKIITTFRTSLSSLVLLVMDVPYHPKWIYKCKKAYVVKEVSDSELYYYHETEAPWPASDRDGVAHVKVKQDPKSRVVNIEVRGVSGMVPIKPQFVRVPKIEASWTFTPVSEGVVKGEYRIKLDPGGNIPAWIINLFIEDGPYASILSMREALKTDKFRNARLAYIQD